MCNEYRISKNQQTFRFGVKHGDQIKKLVFIGNGCVEGGWRLIKDRLPDRHFHMLGDDYIPMFISYINKERIALHVLTSHFCFNNPQFNQNFQNFQGFPDVFIREKLQDLNDLSIMRSRIGEIFAQASEDGSISLRIAPHLWEIMTEPNTLVITTNWDRLLWNAEEIHNLIQLHGLASHDIVNESLVFPTELKKELHQLYVCFENEIQVLCTNLNQHALYQKLQYRANIQLDSHNCTMLPTNEELLQQIDEIIIAGLALNDYDTELSNILSDYRGKLNRNIAEKNRPKLRKITIFNPSVQAANRAYYYLQGISEEIKQEFYRDLLQEF